MELIERNLYVYLLPPSEVGSSAQPLPTAAHRVINCLPVVGILVTFFFIFCYSGLYLARKIALVQVIVGNLLDPYLC